MACWRPLLTLALGLLVLLAPAGAGPDLRGDYELLLSDDASWHHHRLSLEGSSGELVRGTLGLDWGLGPQARAPGPDECLHQVSFEGRWTRDGALQIQVSVGTRSPTPYRFLLYPIQAETRLLVGTVEVGSPGSEDERRAAPFRQGVLARPLRD